MLSFKRKFWKNFKKFFPRFFPFFFPLFSPFFPSAFPLLCPQSPLFFGVFSVLFFFFLLVSRPRFAQARYFLNFTTLIWYFTRRNSAVRQKNSLNTIFKLYSLKSLSRKEYLFCLSKTTLSFKKNYIEIFNVSYKNIVLFGCIDTPREYPDFYLIFKVVSLNRW